MIIQGDQKKGIIGFIFLKDIFEEMIKSQIHDKDLHYDSVNKMYGKPQTQVNPIILDEPREIAEFDEDESNIRLLQKK